MKPLQQAPPVSSSISWWTQIPREGFTKQAEQEQPRMSASRLGKGRGRVISTDELEPR